MIKPFSVIIVYTINTLRGFILSEINIQKLKDTYDKYQNLKLAASELNMKWQNLYYHLQKVGHPITGNKEKYGSTTDKLARYTENKFKNLIPSVEDLNDNKFQAKLDFKVGEYYVDVKASTKKDGYKNNPRKNASFRWAFCCKVQEQVNVDFLVCYCYSGYEADNYGYVEKILLIPYEFFKNMQSISVSCRKSKWFDFEVTESELKEFFDSI